NPQTIEVGSPYVELGASASDNYDGDISGSIVIDASSVNTAVVGSYAVTYDVTDAIGNAAVSATRTVDVVDTTVPVITLSGANPQVIEVGSVYSELGATASDNYDGDISGSIVIDASAVNTVVVGSYAVFYDVTDANGNPGSAIRPVHVVDTTVPIVTLAGANPLTIEVGSTYIELGASASDNYDGDISGSIVIDASAVDTGAVGSNNVFYNVTDTNGNAATTVTRTVNVVDTTLPVITLIGASPQTIEVGSAYSELGASASDNFDGDLSASIVIDASVVDTSAVGSYSVTYDVTDANGNPAATATRTVNVVDSLPPVVSLLGGNPLQLLVGESFLDPGATAIDAHEGDLSSSIVADQSAVSVTAAGTYVVVYSVSDSAGNTATAIRQVVVVVPNSPPIAVDDNVTVNDVGAIGIPAPGVLSNDSDPDGDPLTANLVTGPEFGELVLNPSGSFTYAHDGLGGVDDTFVYRVTDGQGGVDFATVTIRIPVLNSPPEAEDVVLSIDEDARARVAVTDGADPDGDPLEIEIIRQPEVGEASVADDVVVFTPPADWSGDVTIGYSLTDDFGSTSSGSISISVEPVNDPPTAVPDAIVLDNYLTTSLEVLRNDTDIEGDSLSLFSFTQPEHGTVELIDGELRYTPETGWSGEDTFTYTIIDSNGASSTVEVVVEVLPAALSAAIELAGVVGTGLLEIAIPEPTVLARVALDSPRAVRLFAEAVFQSVSALQIPLIVLLIGALWFLVGGTPWMTGLLAKRRHWAVVWVSAEDKLNVYAEPNESSSAVFKLLPNARGIVSLGRPIKDRETGITWLPIEADAGRGWANLANLTEDIDEIEFSADRRPAGLIDRLARLRRRTLGSALYGARGMFVSLNGQAVNVPSKQVADILTNNHGGEAPSLLELFLESWRSGNHELAVDAPPERAQLIPAECKNYHYVSVRAPGSPGWMVFFEYRHGRARIAGLGAEA
ncbi:MAG: immunoglobulin-like domain-containing protein, partial [Acidimicrobiia bacterium]